MLATEDAWSEMSNTKENLNENLAGCLIGLLLMPFLVALRGWVLATLWRWLLVPVFHIQPLTAWQAIGVSIIVGVFTMRVPAKDDESALEGVIRTTVYSLAAYGFALLLGWIVRGQL